MSRDCAERTLFALSDGGLWLDWYSIIDSLEGKHHRLVRKRAASGGHGRGESHGRIWVDCKQGALQHSGYAAVF